MKNYIYCRISRSWRSESEHTWIGKLGSTQYIEYRKWWGETERQYPTYYKWFLTIKDLGRFSSVVSAEKTIYKHPFFEQRHQYNGEGSGTELFEFNTEYDDPLKKVCEFLVQYDVIFEVTMGDPFPTRPQRMPKKEELPYAEPLPLITHQESKNLQYREYQEKIVEKMSKTNLGTVVLATGLGKTVVFSLYIKKTGGRYLIVVPTKNLVDQTIDTCQKIIGEEFKYYKYKKGFLIPDSDNLIVVGTYYNSHNLREIENMDCIIFDECHNTVVLNPPKSEKEKLTLSRFQLLLDYLCEKKFFFTATEKNLISDGTVISMDNRETYGEVLYKYELDDAITDGYLTDYRFHLVATDNKKLATKQYVERGYKSVVFCALQNTVEEVYLYLRENLPKNIRVFKLGKDDNVDRNTKLFSKYKGRAVIVACRKINVGYDEPQIDTVIHYDISTSSIMTIQRNGRGLRLNDDKVMATLVFLCDVSGDEESRKEEIKSLQKPISYLKSIDSRLEKRIEKELMKSDGEFKTVDIIIEGDFTDEKREIYDRCWNILNKGLNYEEVKEILRKKDTQPYCKSDYKRICENDPRLPVDPEETFDNFLGWVDFLGIDKTQYYTVEECKEKIQEYKSSISKYIKPTEKCQKLSELEPFFPPIDMWVEIYGLKKIDDMFQCDDNEDEDIPKWLK